MLDYQAPKDLFQQQVILVTGAGQGIGLQAALHFAAHGATVILLGRTQAKLEAAYDAIVQQGYSEPVIFPMDLLNATEAQMQAMAEAIYQQLGRLDGILHNATHFDNLSPLAIQTGQQFQDMMQVNLIAPFMLTKACLPLLEQAEHASVIFTSTLSAHHVKPFWGAHAISKLAADYLMQLWANELDSSHIRFNSIIPGAVQSPQRKKTHPGEVHADLPSVDSLMPLYLYLMGKHSVGISGQVHEAQSPHVQWE